MDLRDIQRLHAQFAPDSMTIDLPRQIAALPAPADMAADAKAPTIKVRLPKAAPAVRRTLVAVTIAAVVGMAGMGAASLYKSVGGSSVHSGSSRSDSDAGKLAPTEQLSAPATRPIDAEPAHPVAVAPMLTAKDLAPSGVGLTADQFRNSLGSNSPAVSASPAKSGPAVSTDEQRAAASPIHQARRDADAVQQPAANSPAMKPAAPAAQNAEQQPTTSATTSAPAATTQATDGATTETSAPSHSRSYHHHAKRQRDEKVSDTDSAAASNKKAAPSTRGGSNEVQMF